MPTLFLLRSVSLSPKFIFHFSWVDMFLHLVTESWGLSWLLCFLKKRFHRFVCLFLPQTTTLLQTLVSSITYGPTQSSLSLWQKIRTQFSCNHKSAKCFFFLNNISLFNRSAEEIESLLFQCGFLLAASLCFSNWLGIPNYTKCCFIIVSDTEMKWSLGRDISLVHVH